MDIHDYKKRLERVEENIRKSNLSQKNKKILFDFERQLFIKEFTTARIETYLSVLRVICEKLNKDLDSLEKEDIELFLEWLQRKGLADWTKYSYKICFKSFLKAKGKKELAEIIPIRQVEEKIPDIFTKQEVLKMIETALHPMDKALIATLYETGCRIGEIANLQNKDVHFDNYGAILIVGGKTGMRRIRAIFSAPYLSMWFDLHPKKLDISSPVWIRLGKNGRTCGLENDNTCQQLKYNALTIRIKRIAKRAGIQKRVYNHLFRHTSATEKSEILTGAQLCEYYGWKQGSRMPRTYIHLSGKNLDDTLLRAYGLFKDNTPNKDLAPIKCPRCGTVNGATGKFCYKCGAALDLLTAVNVDKERASLTMELMDLIRKEPALLELLKGHMEAKNGL